MATSFESVPLPAKSHIKISKDEIGDRDVFLIGDVHGCLDELKHLIKKAKVTPENCLIIFCGDIINKGPKNIETLNFVRDLGAFTVRGNHEENVVNQWMKYQAVSAKGKTYKPKKEHLEYWYQKLTDDDIKYIVELPYTISIPSLDAIVVHAGLVPGIPLKKQKPTDMVLMRNLILGKDGVPKASEEHDVGSAWAQHWPGPQHVYFGHNARRGLQQHKFATGLDTACVKGKKLTGIFMKGSRASELVSVKSKFAC